MRRIFFFIALSSCLFSVNSFAISDWSIDEQRKHKNLTEKLPFINEAGGDGLFQIYDHGLFFRARIYGRNNTGPAVVMLHGFPGSSIMWNSLARKAASFGYRVLAYDQRGYSPGARPKAVRQYAVDYFMEDLRLITKQLGFKKYHLVGHDIGCVVAWGAAMVFPQRLSSLSCLSIPNPEILELRNYIKIFSIPLLPETVLRGGDSYAFRKLLPEGRSVEENEEYRLIFTEMGSLTATLNFYRAIYTSKKILENNFSAKIKVPTLFLYGQNEGWVDPVVLMKQKKRMAEGVSLSVKKIDKAGKTGHFLMEMSPKKVIGHILNHIKNH